jgi:hypothetical protein
MADIEVARYTWHLLHFKLASSKDAVFNVRYMSNIPMLKKRTLTERITVPCDKETKQKLSRLKYDKGVNVPEWIRQLIQENISKVS